MSRALTLPDWTKPRPIAPKTDIRAKRLAYIRQVQRAVMQTALVHRYFSAADWRSLVPAPPPGVSHGTAGPALRILQNLNLLEVVAFERNERQGHRGRAWPIWKVRDREGCRQWLDRNPPGPEDPPTNLQLPLNFF